MNQDKDLIINIMAEAFSESHRINAILKRRNPKMRLRVMAEYAYELMKKFDGIYFSEDKTTVIFYYTKKQYRRNLIDLYRYLRMYLICIRPEKTLSTLRREKMIKNLRPDIPDYIYVWVLGSDPSKTSIRGLADIRDHLFNKAKELNLPILLETTVEKVVKLYRYVGFEIYREVYDKTIDMPVWFMKKGDIGEGTNRE